MNINPKLNGIKDCLYRVAVKAIIIKDNQVVLVKDAGDTGWSFPGGGVDHGESAFFALKRELSEELGVNQDDIRSDEKVAFVDIGHANAGVPRCNLFYFVTLNNYNFDMTNEVDEQAWFNINDIEIDQFESSTGHPETIIKLIKSRV